MSKYEKLGVHLRRQPGGEIDMTFSEIEKIIGSKLPPSSRFPAWWSNNPSNNVMTKVWLREGFKTEQVNIEARTLVFRRVAAFDALHQGKEESPMIQKHLSPQMQGMADAGRVFVSEPPAGSADSTNFVHPAFGSMKGWITVMPGVDLTEPADPDWANLIEEKYEIGKP